MKKHLFSTILSAACLSLCLGGTACFNDADENNSSLQSPTGGESSLESSFNSEGSESTEELFSFRLNDEGDAYVLDSLLTETENVIIPATYKDLPIKKIAKNAFASRHTLQNVILSDGIAEIDEKAFFDCKQLKTAILPDSVKTVGANAFYRCEELTYVSSAGVEIVGAGAFAFTALRQASLPAATRVDYRAFGDCELLTDLLFSNTLTEIDKDAFENVTIKNAVAPALALKSICSDSLQTITITGGNIPNNSFYSLDDLLKVTLESGVETLGSYAFYNCPKLTDVKLSDTLTEIGDNCFARDTALIKVELPESLTIVGDNAFDSCQNLTNVTIPDGITYVGTNAFSNCTSLRYSFYDGMRYLGNEKNPYLVLWNAALPNLRSCIIQKTTKVICSYAFFEQAQLTTLTLPSNLLFIGECAFAKCESLTSLHIPEKVAYIGGSPVWSTSLTAITVEEGNEYYSSADGVLYDEQKTTLISYPTLKADERFTLPDSVHIVEDNAFWGNGYLQEVILPENLTAIEGSAFYDCRNLSTISLPNGLEKLGNAAFAKSGIASMVIPEKITQIPYSLFENCTNLHSVTLPEKVQSVEAYAFQGCTALTEITLPETLSSLGRLAFAECSSLESVALPKKLSYIGDNAFHLAGIQTALFSDTQSSWTLKNPDDNESTTLSGETLKNPSLAADYLTETYRLYAWRKTTE